MDSWAARVHRHIPSVQYARISSSGDRHIFTEDEGSDEVRAWFPCPFCYVEIEVPLLCVHLQDEHCFGLKNAVCPICAANLGKDPLSHFTMQHSHSIKPRKKSQKSGFWSNIPTNAVKDFREESWFVGSNSFARPDSGNDPAPDLLLSPFLCNVPKDSEENVSSCDVAARDEQSRKPSAPDEVEEEDYEEKIQRANFFQELIFSTIF
ncbi:hypothetical protein OROGR_004478 [Orobanche gracilis]